MSRLLINIYAHHANNAVLLLPVTHLIITYCHRLLLFRGYTLHLVLFMRRWTFCLRAHFDRFDVYANALEYAKRTRLL